MPEPVRFQFGLFDFHPATRQLRREGAPVRLQAQPAHVLALLLANAGEIVTRETLRQALWGPEIFVDFDRSLNFCVAQIRSALGDSAESPRYVKTLPKRGYSFIAPVSQDATQAPPQKPAMAWKVFAAFAIGTAAVAALIALRPHTPPPPIRVAIARFDNQTGNPALDRFADGLTDTLVAEMTAAGAGQLAIIGNAAVLRLPREKRDLAAIANSVRASYVVLGQVQQSASGTRVLAHLIRLPDGSHIEVVRLDPAAPNDLDDSGSGFSKRVATNFPKRILTDARQKQNSQFWPSVSFQRYLAPRLFLASKPVGPSPRLGMPTFPLRRTLLKLAPLSLASQAAFPAGKALSSTFPAQPPELAQEMVSVSHGNLERVRELVTAHPTLAKATWDWGFGDWETALGAASHVGNREIALYLIEQGATPTLFSAAMLGQLATVKAIVAANPAAQRIPGPHSIGLLTHARNGGTPAAQVLLYLESLGDADAPPAIPLTQADMLAIAGTYNFGTNDHIEISLAKGAAVFQRQGTTARNLHHLGNRVFHPAGAAAVRIAFKESPAATTLSILDPGLVLTATKSASPA